MVRYGVQITAVTVGIEQTSEYKHALVWSDCLL